MDAKQAEVNKINEANEFYEDMQSRKQTVSNWRLESGAAEENNVDAPSTTTESESGNGEDKKEAVAAMTTDGMPSQAGTDVSLTPNG